MDRLRAKEPLMVGAGRQMFLRTLSVVAVFVTIVFGVMLGVQALFAHSDARLAYAMLATMGVLGIAGVGLRLASRDVVAMFLVALPIVALATEGGYFKDATLSLSDWVGTASDLAVRAFGLVFPVLVGMMLRRALIAVGEIGN
jgi:hypothetical protein